MPMKKIHLVKAWSGNLADEKPACGADKAKSFSRRTIFAASVTCKKCEAIAGSWSRRKVKTFMNRKKKIVPWKVLDLATGKTENTLYPIEPDPDLQKLAEQVTTILEKRGLPASVAEVFYFINNAWDPEADKLEPEEWANRLEPYVQENMVSPLCEWCEKQQPNMYRVDLRNLTGELSTTVAICLDCLEESELGKFLLRSR